jgi:hypothetical protein
MPYIIVKNFNDYSIVNSLSGHTYSKHNTLNKTKKELENIKSLYVCTKYSLTLLEKPKN